MANSGLDPRQHLSVSEKHLVYERSGGYCQRCGVELGVDYHNSHLASFRNGGGTSLENMEAWCPRCNLSLGGNDEDSSLLGVALRAWQQDALPKIAETMFHKGFATLQAAPGAGKTLFVAELFKKLNETGYVDRLAVVVPNKALLQQWQAELGRLGIRLDIRPRNGAVEHHGLAGVVITYQSLPSCARVHAVRQGFRATLVVLDEVHHVATEATWGWAVREMVGDVATGSIRASAVLNMTGTLFRSNPSDRISTVQYERTMCNGSSKLQARADYSVSTRELIKSNALRVPDLYSYASYARFLDLPGDCEVGSYVADLDEQHRGPVITETVTSRKWIRGFAREAYQLLKRQLESLDWQEPLKLLFIASDQASARAAAKALNKAVGTNFARLVISDEPGALTTLRIAKHEPRPCGIVTVRMITEGFDCPQVATIAYASNVVASLTISQMMARAMRVTGTERSSQTIPAKILIPDHPVLRSSFMAAVRNCIPVVNESNSRGSDFPENELGWISVGGSHQLLDISDPKLRSAMVLDQEEESVTPVELNEATNYCHDVNIPEAFALRVAVLLRRRGSR